MISRVLNTLAAAAVLTFAATSAHASKEAPVIGFSIDDLISAELRQIGRAHV